MTAPGDTEAQDSAELQEERLFLIGLRLDYLRSFPSVRPGAAVTCLWSSVYASLTGAHPAWVWAGLIGFVAFTLATIDKLSLVRGTSAELLRELAAARAKGDTFRKATLKMLDRNEPYATFVTSLQTARSRTLLASAAKLLTALVAWLATSAVGANVVARIATGAERPSLVIVVAVGAGVVAAGYAWFSGMYRPPLGHLDTGGADRIWGLATLVMAGTIGFRSWRDYSFLSAAGSILGSSPAADLAVLEAGSALLWCVAALGGLVAVVKHRVGRVVLFASGPCIVWFQCSSWLMRQSASFGVTLDDLAPMVIVASLFLSFQGLLLDGEGPRGVERSGSDLRGQWAARVLPFLLVLVCAWLAVLVAFGVNAFVAETIRLADGDIPRILQRLPIFLAAPLRGGTALMSVVLVPFVLLSLSLLRPAPVR